jgi:hypothetical protein
MSSRTRSTEPRPDSFQLSNAVSKIERHQTEGAIMFHLESVPVEELPVLCCQRGISEEHRSSQHIIVEEQMVHFVEEAVRAARGRGADRGNSKDKLRRSAVGPVGIVRHRIPAQPEVLAGCSPEL